MEDEYFSPLDNTLVKDSKNRVKSGIKPKAENYIEKFNIKDDVKGLITYTEKVMVLKNGEWDYDTYYTSIGDITKDDIKKYILKLEKDYEIEDISHEFHGGPPMGTDMFDYNEIKGDNVWVVNLKANLYSYLKKNGYVGDLVDVYDNVYSQMGGSLFNKQKLSFFEKLKLDFLKVNNIVIDTINKLFYIEENKPNVLDETFYENVKQSDTNFDGEYYYTYITIYKDGKYLDKVRVQSRRNPIEWKYVVNKILDLNKTSEFYGYVYRLSYSWNKGIILETTGDQRYQINYKCK